MRKSTALLVGLFLIAAFGGLAFWLPDNATHLGAVLTAIVTLVGAYIGLQVMDNGVRGKYFNQDLYNAENPQGEKK